MQNSLNFSAVDRALKVLVNYQRCIKPRMRIFQHTPTPYPALGALVVGIGLICANLDAYAQSIGAEPPRARQKPQTIRIVEDVPAPGKRATGRLIRVSAEKTPSGLAVPRFVSLKYSKSYGRTGPSKQHPVQWSYKRRGLPMIVVAETEMWRKVRDVGGDESWMHKSLLSGKKMVLVRNELVLRAKPRSDSRAKARAAKGVLLKLEECENGWCEVIDEKTSLSGYALQGSLWGAGEL